MAECFAKRSGRSHGNTLAVVSNDPYVKSESIPIEPLPTAVVHHLCPQSTAFHALPAEISAEQPSPLCYKLSPFPAANRVLM